MNSLAIPRWIAGSRNPVFRGPVSTASDRLVTLKSRTSQDALPYAPPCPVSARRPVALGRTTARAAGADARRPLAPVEEGAASPPEKPYSDFMERFHQAYVDEMVAFTDLVAGRIETPCSVQEALQAFLVAEACDLSRREGRPVRMDEGGQ